MTCERQIYLIRQEYFYQVLRHETAWFDQHQSGELTTRLNEYVLNFYLRKFCLKLFYLLIFYVLTLNTNLFPVNQEK